MIRQAVEMLGAPSPMIQHSFQMKKSPSRGSRPRMNFALHHILICILIFLGLIQMAFYIIMFTTDKSTMRKSLLGQTNAVAHDASSSAHQRQDKIVLKEATTSSILPRATVAYAISITGCGDGSEPFIDGGAVLKQSIHLSSIHNPESKSKYSYKMYAIIHPSAVNCSAQLADYGYTILVRDVPVAVKDIQGDFLRERVVNNGCCGEKEYIKLHAYTLTSHPIVVHLDLDTLILKPLDDVFDAMMYDDTTAVGKQARHNLPVFQTPTFPKQPNAFFTRDYNMHRFNAKHKALVQGGFLILRPSNTTFNEFCELIRVGDYRSSGGWGGKGYAQYGAMTFQGIIPYFYDFIQTGTSVELNRCIYNNMCDNPRDKRTVNDIVSGNCLDGREDCEDCRSADLSTIKTAHFTLCQKPWHCLPQDGGIIQERLCRKLHHEWFRIRKDLELDLLKTKKQVQTLATGTFNADHFFGFCKNFGHTGYIPFQS